MKLFVASVCDRGLSQKRPVNEDRAQGESDFSNNTGRLSDRLRD